ncbi:MAG TPA: AraC family transcriptional regulator [Firmicutes bacterium]|nr:AraC family transcriptional regulator [Bacillota bacterium]
MLKGKGWLKTEAGNWSLAAGDLFCIFPGHVVAYGTDPNNLFVSAWFGCMGSEVDAVIKNVGFCHERPIVNIMPLFSDVYDLMRQMREELIAKKPGFMQRNAGSAWNVFGLISRSNTPLTAKVAKIDIDMQQVASYINVNYSDIGSVGEMARTLGYSRSYLGRKFKEYFGVSPHQFLSERRIDEAKRLLQETDLSIKTIAYSVGYRSQHYFSRDFTARLAIPPTEYRRQNKTPSPSRVP